MALDLERPEWELYQLEYNLEHDLQDSVVVEYNDIQGIKINYYMRNEAIDMDQLYGESVNTAYVGPYETKMTYEVTEEPTMTSEFGITSIDVIQYGWIPTSTFSRDVSASQDPKPGDVIQTPWNERAYEVVDVGQEGSIFQLKKNVWEFILKPYRFSAQSDSAEDVSYDVDSTLSEPLTAYSDNEYITEQSDSIDDYDDVDESVYGF